MMKWILGASVLMLVACQSREHALMSAMNGIYSGAMRQQHTYLQQVTMDSMVEVHEDTTWSPVEVVVSLDDEADDPQVSIVQEGVETTLPWNARVETDTAVVWEQNITNDYTTSTYRVSFYSDTKRLLITDESHGLTTLSNLVRTFDGTKQ